MKQMLFVLLASAFTLALGAAGTFWSRDTWLPLVQPVEKKKEDDHAGHTHGSKDKIKLSAQARANLRLVTDELELKTFRRTIQVPGVVVERRGKGDQSFTAPISGVVKAIHALPGDVVHPGDPLVTLRINSEPLQSSQTELYKTAQEIKITSDQKERLDKLFKQGTVPETRILELQYQLDRLGATRKAYRADLAVKGLLPAMVDQVEKGEFLKEIVVFVPSVIEGFKSEAVGKSAESKNATPHLEIEDLKVFLGEQVQFGQLLGYLSNHQNLYIEGRGFREDTPLLEKTAAKNWALAATFHEEKGGAWPPLEKPLTILYLANNIDPVSQTFPFYVPLPNQYREYEQAGKKYRIWRYRPGQRVQLGAPVQEFEDVFVLPLAAVVREGAEAYVFRQNGDVFERKPVHVLYEDSNQVVLANDGISVLPGDYVAHNAADALNRALKAQSEEGGKTGHEGHSH
jgi:multidrug efflux pump subunit AcrA (membrane-fusion protein)